MKTCPAGFRPCTRCHSGKTNGHALDHARVREFRPPGSAQRPTPREETMTESEMGALCYRGYRVSRLHEKFLAVSKERRRLCKQLAEARAENASLIAERTAV